MFNKRIIGLALLVLITAVAMTQAQTGIGKGALFVVGPLAGPGNPTHWDVPAGGFSIAARIDGPTAIGVPPEGTTPVYVKSSLGGNTIAAGTTAGFTYITPTSGNPTVCATTIVAYVNLGLNSNNAYRLGWAGPPNAQPSRGLAVAGFRFTVGGLPFQCGQIHGRKTDDQGNGLPDWQINLTGIVNGNPVSLTTYTCGGTLGPPCGAAPVGTYWFFNLVPGTYTICEVLQSGWIPVTPVCQTVVVSSGQIVTGIDFVNKPQQLGCTLGQGFWKTHFPGSWPASVLAGGLTLGTVPYTAVQLQSIFNTVPAGNGLISLAHQLIAAKLNIANGASSAPVAGTIAAADALIDGLIVPPVGVGFLAPAVTGPLTSILDAYNNGLLGVPPCP